MKREQMMKFFNRFREPSTLAGIAALGIVFGLPAETMNAVAQVVTGLAGLGAIFLPESKAE